MRVRPPGREDPLEKEMATHFSILAWENSMDRGAWQAIVHGAQRVERDWSDLASYISQSPLAKSSYWVWYPEYGTNVWPQQVNALS